MAKKRTSKEQPWKPWAKVWEDDGWYVEYSVIQGRVNRMNLEAETLDDAICEASSLTEIPQEEIAAD
jgi:hypothetical protein